jgi:SWI/SNF-related matrix-associated actin-dependent regulator of chromatin subfamily A member 5
MAANVNGLFTQVTQKLQQSIVRHVSIKECSSRHLLPAECSAPRQKRVTSEDLSRAAEVCLASFSRHVDLLEPFIERSVVAEMRATLPQEFVDDATDWPQPSTICGTMRPYQIKGLNWLICQHRNSIGSILADEMGLGKTIQTIAFIAHLLLTQERPAPHLIVVPLSVLSNWGNEFKKFCPCIRVKRIHVYSGNEAIKIFREIAHPSCPYDVIMTTYEVIRSDFWISKLVRINWHTLVLDEGHRVKNERTEAAHTCSLLRARFRLILTGTPIQNNMHESWALLNFLNPKVFTASVTFDKTFNLSSQNSNGLQTSQQLLDQCHKIMRLVFLRRLKSEVRMNSLLY